MRKRHATTCKPVQSPPDTLGKDLPPLRRDSCVRMLTGWKIDDLAFVAACGGVSIHQISTETVRCASLVIMVEVGRMDEIDVDATRFA